MPALQDLGLTIVSLASLDESYLEILWEGFKS